MNNKARKVLDKIQGKSERDYARIRRTLAYDKWTSWVKFLRTKPTISEILLRIDEDINNRMGYRYQWHADANRKILNLVLQELKEKEYEEKQT